jgi:hypothetical protein
MFKKKNNKKKIIFTAQEEHAQFSTPIPKPASNIIPEWYRKQKSFSVGTNDFLKSLKNDGRGTYKLCVPFVDTLTSGYLITLPATIVVQNSATDGTYDPKIIWEVGWEVLDVIHKSTHEGYPVPEGFSPVVFRWFSGFIIETPPGYSSWITHPSHRWDLPFLTINGFIDTDKHPNSIFLPFFIKEGFEGIIEAGTPIAQIIPIKRDVWQSEKKDLSNKEIFLKRNAAKIDYVRTYRKRYWSKKKYE